MISCYRIDLWKQLLRETVAQKTLWHHINSWKYTFLTSTFCTYLLSIIYSSTVKGIWRSMLVELWTSISLGKAQQAWHFCPWWGCKILSYQNDLKRLQVLFWQLRSLLWLWTQNSYFYIWLGVIGQTLSHIYQRAYMPVPPECTTLNFTFFVYAFEEWFIGICRSKFSFSHY